MIFHPQTSSGNVSYMHSLECIFIPGVGVPASKYISLGHGHLLNQRCPCQILDLRERGSEVSRPDIGRSSTNNGLHSVPRCYQGSTSIASTHSSPRSPQSTGGVGVLASNRGSTRNKGQVLVSTKNVSGVTTTITMGKGVINDVELAEMSKEDVNNFGDDDDFKIDMGGVGGIRVEVEKTSTSL